MPERTISALETKTTLTRPPINPSLKTNSQAIMSKENNKLSEPKMLESTTLSLATDKIMRIRRTTRSNLTKRIQKTKESDREIWKRTILTLGTASQISQQLMEKFSIIKTLLYNRIMVTFMHLTEMKVENLTWFWGTINQLSKLRMEQSTETITPCRTHMCTNNQTLRTLI